MRIGFGMGISGPAFLVGYNIALAFALAARWWLSGAISRIPLAVLLVAGTIQLIGGIVHDAPVTYLLIDLSVTGGFLLGPLRSGGGGGGGGGYDCASCSSGGGGCGGGCGGCGGD